MPKGPEPPEGLPPGIYVTLSSGDWSNTASFQLSGPKLDPDVVTRAVEVEPSRAWRRGDLIGPGNDRTRRQGSWSLDSKRVLSPQDAHLDEHMRWLLDQLEPRTNQLKDAVTEQELKAEVWSAVYMEGANVDFELPPTTLARIAALGATLRLDIYAPDDVALDEVEIPGAGGTLEPSDAD